MAFSTWLTDMIAAKQMTRPEFIATVGAGKTTVSQWVSGKNYPSAKQILAIAHVLEVPPSDVLQAIADEEKQPVVVPAGVLNLPPRLREGEAALVSRLAWAVRHWREEDEEQTDTEKVEGE